jgi:ribosomal protein L2
VLLLLVLIGGSWGKYANIKMPSGEVRRILQECGYYYGAVSALCRLVKPWSDPRTRPV